MKRATSGTPVARRQRAESTPCIDAYREHGNLTDAAKAIHLRRATFSERLAAERAAVPTTKAMPKPKTAPARRAAPAKGGTDLTSAVAALVASQVQQGKLLERLLKAEDGIRVPKKAKVEDETPPEDKPVAGGTLAEPEATQQRRTGRRFILTSAQNNSLVHADFLASLQTMARHTGAEIIISRFTYNKAAWERSAKVTRESDEIWYAEELRPYLTSASIRLAEDLVFCAELDRLPTAVDPLSGLDSYTKESSGVVGHPKVAMKSMAVMNGFANRFMFSTGCVTQRHYIDRLAGQKAAFHHTFAALYVEVDADGLWFARQLVAGEAGEFQDLATVYTPNGTREARVAAIVWGDIHRIHMAPEMQAACWGPGGILETLRPAIQVKHDTLHFQGRSHHSVKDPFLLAEFMRTGADSVEGEIRGDARFLLDTQGPEDCITIVPEANHNTHLRRWLTESDFRSDPVNARYGHYLAWRTHQAIDEGRGSGFNVYEFAVREAAQADGDLGRTRFLTVDESFVVAGVELGLHGDNGPNGSRGSPKSYRQLGRRAVTGHVHSPGIVDGVYTVGVTGSLDQGYNKGPSSWAQSHCLVYENGKRAIVTHRGARWRAKPRVRVKAGSAAANDDTTARAAA